MQEILTDGSGGLHFQAVLRGKGVHSDHLDNLIEGSLILQQAHQILAGFHPVTLDILIKPGLQVIQIQTVGSQPVNRREMPLVRQLRVQTPEHLDDTECSLGNRLGDISSGRGNRSDRGELSLPAVPSQRDDTAGPLVKLCQTGAQISRVSFLSGHLLQTSGHLTQGFRPPGGGVGHQRHGISHITEILCHGYSGINGCLSGSHGHIGGIGNQDGSLHQRFAGAGIFQFRKFIQNIRHFVSTLSAADIHDDIRLGPLGQLMLRDRLSGSERSGNRGNSALGNREESINNPLPGDQRHIRRKLFRIGSAPAHRPLLHQCQRLLSLLCLHNGNGFLYRVGTGLYALQPALHAVRNHNFLFHHGGLLNGSQNVPCLYFFSRLCRCVKFPFFIPVQSGYFHASGQQVALGFFHDFIQGSLNTVIDRSHQSGSQLYRKRTVRGFHGLARSQAAGLLIYLN